MRGVIQSGWARLHGDDDDILTIGDIPHSWLFPRVAAVVHHGGAGTVAAALRAGVPAVAVTGIVDQPFWGHRLHTLGAATEPLRRIALTEDALADAITTAVHQPRYRQCAQHVSRLLASEDGESTAVDAITTYLDHHSTTRSGGT
jgi:sterol 3beta-glucosyltransferase